MLPARFQRIQSRLDRGHLHAVSLKNTSGNDQIHRLIVYDQCPHTFTAKLSDPGIIRIIASVESRYDRERIKRLLYQVDPAALRKVIAPVSHDKNKHPLGQLLYISRIRLVLLLSHKKVRKRHIVLKRSEIIEIIHPVHRKMKTVNDIKHGLVIEFPDLGHGKLVKLEITADSDVARSCKRHGRGRVDNLLR